MMKALCFVAGLATTFSSCRDERECSALIAKSIVAGAKECRSQTYDKEGSKDFRNCVSDFCYTKCGQNEDCTQMCESKGHAIYHRVGSLIQVEIEDAMQSPDELEELRQANPSAYAIVKALLTKRSLGLLNPRHPSASFSAADAPVATGEGPMESASMEPVSPPHQSGGQNWLNWKPADDAQVAQEVLVPAGNLRGNAPDPAPVATPLEDTKFTSEPAPEQTAPPAEEDKPSPLGSWTSIFSHQQSAAVPKQDSNPYLQGVDWGEPKEAPKQQALVADHQDIYNTYLHDLQ